MGIKNDKGVSNNENGDEDKIDNVTASAKAWFSKGVGYKSLGHYKRAIKCYDKALELDSRNANIWTMKGIILAEIGEFAQAAISYEQALQINPKNQEVWINRAQALERIDRNDEALICYDKALKIDPKLRASLTRRRLELIAKTRLKMEVKKEATEGSFATDSANYSKQKSLENTKPSRSKMSGLRWEYAGWSNISWGNIPGAQFVIMTVRGMVLTIIEKHGPLSDSELSQYMNDEMNYPMSINAARDHLKTLSRYGLIRLATSDGVSKKPRPIVVERKPIPTTSLAPSNTITYRRPSHYLDAAFLTRGKVGKHNRTKLGIVITAVVEALYQPNGKIITGQKFAYVFVGKTETANDLVKVLEMATNLQKVTCVECDGRPLYNSNVFRNFLFSHQIELLQKKEFGSMVFIDRVFGQWKTRYVHPFIKEIEKMSDYEKLQYVSRTLKECFPGIIIETRTFS